MILSNMKENNESLRNLKIIVAGFQEETKKSDVLELCVWYENKIEKENKRLAETEIREV